jgi:peptidoglycan/LPS O-acetylase OafA/YrhL
MKPAFSRRIQVVRLERGDWIARNSDKHLSGIVLVSVALAAGFVLHVGRNIDPETPNLWAFYLVISLLIPVIFISLRHNRIDKFFGDLTFPLYISHALVLTFVGDFVGGGENVQRVTALCLALLFAVLLTLAVEMPVERMRLAFGAWIMTPGQLSLTRFSGVRSSPLDVIKDRSSSAQGYKPQLQRGKKRS